MYRKKDSRFLLYRIKGFGASIFLRALRVWCPLRHGGESQVMHHCGAWEVHPQQAKEDFEMCIKRGSKFPEEVARHGYKNGRRK